MHGAQRRGIVILFQGVATMICAGAIYLVALFTQQVSRSNEQNTHEFNSLKLEWSVQLQCQ